jgi:multiple sugar transport system substrate-binding protein
VFSIISGYSTFAQTPVEKKKQIVLSAVLNDLGEPGRWILLFDAAVQELEKRHPDLDITIKYVELPYEQTRSHLLSAMANLTAVDITTIDEIWLGEFAQNGYLTDLSDRSQKWGRLSDWYASNLDGMTFEDKLYGLWIWTAVRAMWFWKDMLNEAGVDPNSLKTWDRYIEAAKKLNSILIPKGIQGIHLTGANHSPDLWYPYLWMLGGSILEERSGHPTKENYWFPTYNSSAGVGAMDFIKAQIDAGIKPQTDHFWGKEFLDRKFAVMLEAVQHHVHLNNSKQKQDFENKIGLLPFPLPDENYESSTLMGGWLLSIPTTSKNKDLAWELITIAAEPKILAPWLAKYGYLPTQVSIGEGSFSNILNQSIPYYNELVSMIPPAGTRPNIPEYPAISEDIKQALDDVYYGRKDPQQALDDAAEKSAKTLGW